MNWSCALFPLSSFFLSFPHVTCPLGCLSPHFSRTHTPPESHSHSSARFWSLCAHPFVCFLSSSKTSLVRFSPSKCSEGQVPSSQDSSPSDHMTQSFAGNNLLDWPSHTHCENPVSRFPLHSPSPFHALVRTS